jgi:hypothetical protein
LTFKTFGSICRERVFPNFVHPLRKKPIFPAGPTGGEKSQPTAQWISNQSVFSSAPSNELPITILGDAILGFRRPLFIDVRSSLGFVAKQLHWGPHKQTNAQQGQRINRSNELLRKLRSIKHQYWQFMITFDESWFEFVRDEHIRLQAEQELPNRLRYIVADQKLMVMVVWNSLGFHLLEAFPKGWIFNVEYYRDKILTAFIQLCPKAGAR